MGNPAQPTPYTTVVYPPPAAAHNGPPPTYDHRDEVTQTITRPPHDARDGQAPADGPSNPILFLALLVLPVLIAALAVPLIARLGRDQ